jgi:hypothetical protein
MQALIFQLEHTVACLKVVSSTQTLRIDSVGYLGTGILTSAISASVASSLNSNITIWIIPILELVNVDRAGLGSRRGEPKKPNRARKMMTPIIERVVFDVFERTVRWRSIINRMRVGGMECRRGLVRLWLWRGCRCGAPQWLEWAAPRYAGRSKCETHQKAEE